MKIIFCDNHLLIVEKPSNMTTQPELQDLAKAWVKKEFSKPGDVFLHPIHRLDKPVSGLVLFARTSKALSRLNQAMRERQIKKTYIGKVEGVLSRKEGVLEHFLMHDDHFARVVDENDPEGKKAILHFKVMRVENGQSLLEIELKTGRYHQIRAQFGAIGHPVMGDMKYGSSFKSSTIALHHQTLSFIHPTLKEELTYQSLAPFSL